MDAELRSRIAWLIQLRWLAIVGTLAAITAVDALFPGTLPIVELVGTATFIGLYNVFFYVYATYLRSQDDASRQIARSVGFVHIQLVLDYVCLTLLLHFSGGAENPLWAFYVLYIIVASLLQTRMATYMYAGLATFLYGGMVLLEYAEIIPHVRVTGLFGPSRYQQETYLLTILVTFAMTLFFATLMGTTIMTRLRDRGRDLVQANSQLETRARELTELNRLLEELDKDRKHFVQLVTHELRAPVAAIESYMKLLLDGYVSPEKYPDVFSRARQRAAEQLEQISDLLVLGQSQRKPTPAGEVCLATILQGVLEIMRGPIAEKNLALRVEVDPDTPNILADPDQMNHLWMNLISNAVKYTPAGGRIDIALTHRPASIVGSVRDTGIGISEEDQKRIFDEFYRTTEAKQIEQHGTGLGLSIVQQIVESYGGRVWVNSAPDKGSKFSFSLPKSTPMGDALLPESPKPGTLQFNPAETPK